MGSLTILYAEDYRLLLHYVKELLEAQGWRVETCADGLSALERIEGDKSYDLLVLDNSLPGMSGLELVRRARSLPHRRSTPIIMLSASDVALSASRAGVNAFLNKPDEIDALVETVKRLTDEGSKPA
jgi:CheY-like chemotaxis protein